MSISGFFPDQVVEISSNVINYLQSVDRRTCRAAIIAFSSVGLYSDNLIIKGVSLAVSAIAIGLEVKEIFNDTVGQEGEQAVDPVKTPEVTMPEKESPSGGSSSKTVSEDHSNDKLAESSETLKKRKRIRGSAKKKEEPIYEEVAIVHSTPVPQKAPAKQPKQSSSSSSYEFIPGLQEQISKAPFSEAPRPVSFKVISGQFALRPEAARNLRGERGADHEVDLTHINEAMENVLSRNNLIKKLHPENGTPVDFRLANQPNKLLRLLLIKYDGVMRIRSCFYITASSLKRERRERSDVMFENHLQDLYTLTGQNVPVHIVPEFANNDDRS